MAEKLNEKAIEKRMMSFNNTQESVQALSLWIMHNRSQHQKIVDTWLKVLRKSETKHKLTLFYLCNDVVQHAKKKKALYYLENFKDNLREAVHIVRELDAIKPNINRIFKIWEERRTYDGKFISELRRILESGSDVSGNSSANATPADSPKVTYKPSKMPDVKMLSSKYAKRKEKQKEKAEESKEAKEKEEKKEVKTSHTDKGSSYTVGDFKTTKFIAEMNSLKQMDSDANLKAKQLAAMRIDATNMEAVKQLKDRSHGAEFCKQFEESCIKIEDYVVLLEKEITQRRQVLSMCDEAEAFYDEQYSEAKIVATAYKNFGARVTNMKKRVDDMKKIIPSTPSPVPSPSADAPSPGNTPPMDDNETLDMDAEDDPEPAKPQEPSPPVQTGGAYTAMVKSIAKPISSVTNITMREKDEDVDRSPTKPDSPLQSSATDTFQGSNILDSRIASMLPNLAKGTSGIGSNPPIVVDLEDSLDTCNREPIPDYVPPKPAPPQVEAEDPSSTPVQDEQEEEEKELSPVRTPPSTKPAPAKVKTNPIDFLSQLLTKTSNSSSSSNFLQSLSLLTNTVKNQYQKKQEMEGQSQAVNESAPQPVARPVEQAASFAAVPPPEPIKQTSTWSAWKTIVNPPQPPLPQTEPPSPPVIPGLKSPDGLNRPPPPQQRPPLPPEPFPVQTPSPQNFSIPPPASQSFLTPSSIGQPYGPPRPNLQPFTPTATSPPAFPVRPVISQAFSNQTSGSSTSPVLPPRAAFTPGFPFGVRPPRDPLPPGSAPPPPQVIVPTSQPPPPPYMQEPSNAWVQSRPDRVPPISQSHVPPEFAPPPSDASLPPMATQRAEGGYGNVIHTLSSNRTNWNSSSESSFRQRELSGESSGWEERDEPDSGAGSGYAHPWDQPYDDDDDDYDIIETMPNKPLPPAPKGILRNRSSSLREVTLVDDSDGNSLGNNVSVGHSTSPVQEPQPSSILKRPLSESGVHVTENPGDVQSEFIAKLKQKSGSSSHMPLPPPSGRTLTSVEVGEGTIMGAPPPVIGGQPISTIGVINSNGRTASVKSDDMELDSDEHDSNVEGNVETSWENTEEQAWQEERQGLVTRDYLEEVPLETPRHPDPFNRSEPHRPFEYDSFQSGGFQAPPPPFRQIGDQFRGPPPPKQPFFPQRPSMPYYRY